MTRALLFLSSRVTCLCVFFLVLMVNPCLQLTHAQDRETLERICGDYATQNKSIRVGVLAKGDSSFPQSAWNGVFGTIATSFLSRFGCRTEMTLYPFDTLLQNVAAGNMDFVFSHPLHGAQVEVQYGGKPLVSLTSQYQPMTDRLPFKGSLATIDHYGQRDFQKEAKSSSTIDLLLATTHSNVSFLLTVVAMQFAFPVLCPGGVTMYAHANMTKPFTNTTVPDWLIQRRAMIDSFAPQSWEDLIALTKHFPPKNLTMCSASTTSFGGYNMQMYEFQKRGVVMTELFTVVFGGSHNECIRQALVGLVDFANARSSYLDPWVNDTRIDPGTFTVINNSPTKFFPQFISTPLYPEWPVMMMPWVDSALAQAFTVPLTALAILTTTPEALAVGGASFSYPFSYEGVKSVLFDLNVIGDGQCAIGWARSLPTDPLPLDPTVPHPCFACSSGTYVKIANGTSTCQLCPVNTYNGGSGINCTACPDGLITTNTGSTSADQCHDPTRGITAISSSNSIAMIVVCSLLSGLMMVVIIGVILLRANPVMKAASPLFLILVLLGLLMLSTSIIPRALENFNTNDNSRYSPPSNAICSVDLWLTNLGYTLVTGALLVKTWRLYSIFYSSQLAGRKPLSDFKLLIALIGLLILQCVIILALTEKEPLILGLSQLDAHHDYLSCSTRADSNYSMQNLYLPAIMVPRFVLLIATTIAAFLVRGLPAAFNESSQLLYTMYNLSFFSVLLPAIDIAVGRGKDAGLIAYSVSMFLICLLTATILFAPKFRLIYQRAQGPSKDQTTLKSSSHSTTGATTGHISSPKRTGSIPLPKHVNGALTASGRAPTIAGGGGSQGSRGHDQSKPTTSRSASNTVSKPGVSEHHTTNGSTLSSVRIVLAPTVSPQILAAFNQHHHSNQNGGGSGRGSAANSMLPVSAFSSPQPSPIPSPKSGTRALETTSPIEVDAASPQPVSSDHEASGVVISTNAIEVDQPAAAGPSNSAASSVSSSPATSCPNSSQTNPRRLRKHFSFEPNAASGVSVGPAPASTVELHQIDSSSSNNVLPPEVIDLALPSLN